MAETKLTVIYDTKGASKVVVDNKKVDDSFDKMGKGAKKGKKSFADFAKGLAPLAVGLGVVAAAGKAVIGWQKENIRLAGIQEDAERQLTQTIKATGGAAGLTATELKSMASGLQGVTKFGDEAILGGQSLLLTFKNIGGDVFPQATETMLDMSQALGQDMKSSAIQLGKALNDPITGVTALQRVGVSFTEQQKEQIKTLAENNDVMGAQTIILNELSAQFGGSARAAAETYTGQIEQLSNTYGDLREQIGFYMRVNTELIAGTNQVVAAVTNNLTLQNKLTAEVAAGNITFEDSQRILREVAFTSLTTSEALAELTEEERKAEEQALRMVQISQERIIAQEELTQRFRDMQNAEDLAAVAAEELAIKYLFLTNVTEASKDPVEEVSVSWQDLAAKEELAAAAGEKVSLITGILNDKLTALGNRHDFLLSLSVEGLEGLQEAINIAGGFMQEDINPFDPEGDRDFGDEFDQSGSFDNNPNPPTTGSNQSNAGIGLSQGGSFVVPAGFPNDSFPIFVESGEHVTVVPKHTVNNNQTFNWQVNTAGFNPESAGRSAAAFSTGGI